MSKFCVYDYKTLNHTCIKLCIKTRAGRENAKMKCSDSILSQSFTCGKSLRAIVYMTHCIKFSIHWEVMGRVFASPKLNKL